jgi:hypothetical protein
MLKQEFVLTQPRQQQMSRNALNTVITMPLSRCGLRNGHRARNWNGACGALSITTALTWTLPPTYDYSDMMKCAVFLVFLTCLACSAGNVTTPGLQNPAPYNNLVMGPNVGVAGWITYTNIYSLPLSSPTAASNTLIIENQWTPINGPTDISLYDASNDIFNQIAFYADTAGGLDIAVWEATNIAGGVTSITFSNNVATGDSLYLTQPTIVELPYYGPIDLTNVWAAEGATITNQATMSPCSSNDLVLQFVACESQSPGTSFYTNFVWGTNMNWYPLAVDDYWGNASQMAVYNSTDAINPTFFVQGCDVSDVPYIEATVFLKPWSLGQSVGGCRVIGLFHTWISESSYFPGGPQNRYWQWPDWGNALVFLQSGPESVPCIYTNFCDSASNSWFVSQIYDNSGNEQEGFAVSTNYQNGVTNRIFINAFGPSGLSSAIVYDIINASVMGNYSNYTGDQECGQTIAMGNFIPNAPNGIILADISQANNTVTNANIYCNVAFCDGQNPDQSGLDQNNGWGYTNLTSVAPINPTWNYWLPSNPPGSWGGNVVFVQSAPVPPTLTVFSAGDFIISFSTVLGQSYQLEGATDLESGQWVAIGESIPGNGGIVQITNTVSQIQQFYRVKVGF